jgi:hypothetical protein
VVEAHSIDIRLERWTSIEVLEVVDRTFCEDGN